MFTDMVGYSALAQADEANALAVLERHNRLLRPILRKFAGREVKTVGDAFLVEFDSALDSARCALEIQRVLHDYNRRPASGTPIRVRIGIHVGDVVHAAGDVLGDVVNIASRVQGVADPEGICVTQQVYDQLQNKVATPFTKLPPVALKNIQVPVGIFKVVQPWDGPAPETPVRPPGSGRSLAVLPLANISPDPSDEYFADGLTEELISSLSQLRGLSVIARTSVVGYKTAPKSVAQVGAELGVDTVLEGSVRKSGNQLRISLQLIDVASQRHLWSNNYNREIDDVFAVQTDIAERTADALRLELGATVPAGERRTPTANVEAYDLYLRGLVVARAHDREGTDDAVRLFEESTRLDPNFAEAYAAWGNLYVTVAGDLLSMREVMPRARELAARAIEIDPQSSEAHATLANIAFQFDLDWSRAEAEFRRAIELNPSNVGALRFYALLLLVLARFEEAKDVYRRIVRLDPGGEGNMLLAQAELGSGNFERASRLMEEHRHHDPRDPGLHVYRGLFYVEVGRIDDARREADVPIAGADDVVRSDHALLKALVGRPGELRRVVREAEQGAAKSYTSLQHLAIYHSALGEAETALDLLERDYREGDRTLWLFYRGVFYDPIRTHPRFVALLRRYGLPDGPIPRARPGPGPTPRPRRARRARAARPRRPRRPA